MGRLNGRAALVTGASRGIGRAIARRFAAEGASVFLAADGTRDELEEAAGECRRLSGEEAFSGEFDLARPEAPEEMVAAALDRLGRLDILVNNAGIRSLHFFGEFTREDFDQVVAVNLRAPFLAAQAVLPAMRATGGGRIVFIASQLGMVAARRTALYGVTKAGLIHLARSMALELAGEGIRVNAISPGPIATAYVIERLEREPEERAQRESFIPAGHLGDPDEIASAALFLASDESGFVDGHNLVVDGGYIAH